jgi:hypothetical protein
VSLSNMFIEMKRRAGETGDDRATDLKGGARMAVRVRSDVITPTISRKEKALGATEVETFKRDCGVPATAERLPDAGQRQRTRDGATWHTITYRWREV